MLSAIRPICSRECLRALVLQAVSRASVTSSICRSAACGKLRAGPAGFGGW
jgi:hypothetical protein